MKKYKYTLKWVGTIPDKNHNPLPIYVFRDNETLKLCHCKNVNHTFETEKEIIEYHKNMMPQVR